jgi:OFA family oxalate/formate antiporter-like MFS transporter
VSTCSAAEPLPFRGWRVVVGAFLVMMSGYGAIYSYAAFVDDLSASLDISRAAASLIFALAGGSAFLVSAPAGWLADRWGPRLLAATGMLVVGLGLALAGLAENLLQACLSYGLLVGIGVGLAYVPAVAAVQRWFVVRRGLASGLAAAGIGVGTTLVPPVTDALSALGDWRAGLFALGGLVAAFGLAGALLLEASPESLGQRPDGETGGSATGPRLPVEGPPLSEICRSRRFLLLYVAVLLVSLPVALPFAHLPRFAQDVGMSRHDAVALLGFIGLGSIAGRVLIGAAADIVGRAATFLSCCAGLSLATLLWPMATPPALAAFALGFGAFYGGFVALLPAFTVDLFGRRSAAAVIGLLYTSRGISLLVAPPAVAVAGGGAWPLAAVAILGLLGAAVLPNQRGAARSDSKSRGAENQKAAARWR